MRSLYYFATHQAPPDDLLEWQPVRGLTAVKEAQATVPGVGTVHVAIVNGMAAGRQILDQIRKGEINRWQFIEFMACPGGCIGGGGQPKSQFASSVESAVPRRRLGPVPRGHLRALLQEAQE